MARGKSKIEKLRETRDGLVEQKKAVDSKIRELDSAIAEEEKAAALAALEKASSKLGPEAVSKLLAMADQVGVEEVLKRLS